MKTNSQSPLLLKQLIFYASDADELNFLANEQGGELLAEVLSLATKAKFENLLFIHPEMADDFKRCLDKLAIHYPLRLVSSYWKNSDNLWSKLLDIKSELAAEFYLSSFPNWGFASQLTALGSYQAELVLAVAKNRHYSLSANQLPAWVQVDKNYLTASSWLKIADYYPSMGVAKITRSWLETALARLIAGEYFGKVLDDSAQDQLIKACFFQDTGKQPVFGKSDYLSLSTALLRQAQESW